MAPKLLVADDERDIVSLIQEGFEDDGYTVWTAYNGYQAMELAKQQPDLILLDVMMPGPDGYEVCQAIRDVVSCPIVFLSARLAESDKIQGLAMGGDDYLIKPFSMKELKERVRAHLRRDARAKSAAGSRLGRSLGLGPNASDRARLRFGRLAISVRDREVTIGGEAVPMTPKEFDIIRLLAMHPGQVFSKEQIYDKVWGLDAMGDLSTVAEHVKNIRAKLSVLDASVSFISTIWGVGYKWERGS